MKLAKDLSLPLAAVTQKLAWLGVTGSGKTYGASKLAELFWHAGAQFIVLDPVGVWYGLRLAKDGKKPSAINIPIFGGLHGDVPLESTGGDLMANLVVDKTLSAILDVSQFESDADKARFAKAFADRFFFRKKSQPSAVHLFIEECQEFVPQNPQRGEEQMLHAFIRMQKLGRNFGIGSSYISQRPQEVNKKALNMAQTLFVFRTTGTHERTAIEKWIEDKSLDESIANDLPKIPTGQCHVWSPEFLKISETAHILEKETFNASATPEVGAVAKARELAPIDLDQVRTEMAATIEKAKADDPRELRKQIRALELQVAGKAMTAVAVHLEKQKPVLTDADRALLEKLAVMVAAIRDEARQRCLDSEVKAAGLVRDAVADYLDTTRELAMEITDAIARKLESKGFQKILDKLAIVQPTHITPTANAAPRSPQTRRVDRALPPSTRSTPARLVSEGATELTPALRGPLLVLANHQADGCAIGKLALLSGKRISGGFRNILAALRTNGWMEGSNTGVMRITAAGLEALGTFEALPTGAELGEYWLTNTMLSPAARDILRVLLAHRSGYSIDALAERVDKQVSGGFRNLLAELRTAGVIVGRNTEVMRANEELFS